jgi:ElaB/YqjD/DUF883 family membrane-anchored ribosome-binding protein
MRANGIAPRTQRSTKDLVKEVTVLKSQLRKLSTAMEADAKDGVNGAMSAIEIKSRAMIDEALEAAQTFIDEQSENARDLADAAIGKTTELRDAAADTLIETVKARPLATLAAVVGIGFLAGFLCRRP